MTNIFHYIDRPSPIHALTGATKLICVLLWSFADPREGCVLHVGLHGGLYGAQ